MFTLFHFCFELFKIAVLAGIYTFMIYISKLILTEMHRQSRASNFKLWRIYFTIAGLLLVYSFTYYGNHGLGDEYYIPLGYGETMNQVDMSAYFEPRGAKEPIDVNAFEVKDNNLCMTSDNQVYVYQLKAHALIKFDSSKLYDSYALIHNLPVVKEFKTFWWQYNAYWSGWRFWVLP